MQLSQKSPLIGSNLVESIVRTAVLPSVQEQADNLIRWLGDNLRGPGEEAKLAAETHGGIVGTLTKEGLRFIVDGLERSGLILTGQQLTVTLTFEGWRRWEELRRGATSGTKAFMAMPYGFAELDRIVNEYFRPAVLETGFRLMRLDDEPKAGPMDDRMRVEIQSSRFLIADLTHGNSGAYWEAGYAEGLRKPVIYTCEETVWRKERTHFDTNHCLHIVWSTGALQDAMERLKATIRITLPEARRDES